MSSYIAYADEMLNPYAFRNVLGKVIGYYWRGPPYLGTPVIFVVFCCDPD